MNNARKPTKISKALGNAFGVAVICTASAGTVASAQTAFVASQTQTATKNQSFVFKSSKPLKSVSVVGSFNNWDKTANPMQLDADGVTWRATLPLCR